MNGSRLRKSRIRLAMFLALVAVVLLIGTILLVNFNREDGSGGLEFVIPAGASDYVEVPTIDSAIEIPTEIVFEDDETPEISIRNDDSVAHRAGPWVVGPGQSYTLRLDKPGEYRFDCSVDPAESVVVTVLEP